MQSTAYLRDRPALRAPSSREMGFQREMDAPESTAFDPATFLSSAGLGRRLVEFRPKQVIFSQGNTADCVYYLQSGRAKLTVVSKAGKEATISLLNAGEFVGEEAIASLGAPRLATATAMTACVALKIDRMEMLRVLREESAFSAIFLKFLLARSMRTQADLVDQLFNNSEKRLARVLLLMAEFGRSDQPDTVLPPITQESLAEMVGTTRSRVSFFMNRFRKLGLIEYNGRIRVHKSLLNVVLHDQLPGHDDGPSRAAKTRPSRPKASGPRRPGTFGPADAG